MSAIGKHFKLVGEDEHAFHIHDGKSQFKVGKHGLSDSTLGAIKQHFAKGGEVQHFDDGGEASAAGGDSPGFLSRLSKGLFGGAGDSAAIKHQEALQQLATGNTSGALVSQMEANQNAKSAENMGKAVDAARGALSSTGQATSDPNVLAARQQLGLPNQPTQPSAPPNTDPGPPSGAAARQVPQPATNPPPQQGTGGGGGPGIGYDPSKLESTERQIGQQESLQAQQVAAQRKAQNEEQEKEMLEHKASQQLLLDDLKKRQDAVQAAQEEINKIDTHIDPGRFWASKSTGERILARIGIALSAVGSGLAGGQNQALAYINNAIDKDIDAQKTQHQYAMEKGRAKLEGAKTLFEMGRQIFDDNNTATASAHAMALDLYKNKLLQAADTYASPLAKLNAQKLAQEMDIEAKKYHQQAYDQHLTAASHYLLTQRQLQAAGGQQGVSDDAARQIFQGAAGATGKLWRSDADERKLDQAAAALIVSRGGRPSPEAIKEERKHMGGLRERFAAMSESGKKALTNEGLREYELNKAANPKLKTTTEDWGTEGG